MCKTKRVYRASSVPTAAAAPVPLLCFGAIYYRTAQEKRLCFPFTAGVYKTQRWSFQLGGRCVAVYSSSLFSAWERPEAPHPGGRLAALGLSLWKQLCRGASVPGVVLSRACREHYPQPSYRQRSTLQPSKLGGLNRLKRGGGSFDVQRAETKWCCSLCALITKQQESIRVTAFLALQQFCSASPIFLDSDLLAAVNIHPWKWLRVHFTLKKKLVCASLAKELASLSNGSGGRNTATALWRVTQRTAALLLLSLPRMPSNQLDEGFNFLICKSMLLHFGTDFLQWCLCNSSQNPQSAVAFDSHFTRGPGETPGLGNGRQPPSRRTLD